jgi:hypothetical protein
MKPIKTPETNVVFKLPGGTDENNLPVYMGNNEHDEKVIISTWELSDEERKVIAEGGMVSLCVWGDGTPPVSLAVVERG